MSTYTSTHTPSSNPLPTLGWQVGPNLVNRCQELNPRVNLIQQQADYFASKLAEVKRGGIKPYEFNTFKEALADYSTYLKQRIPVQLEAQKKAQQERPDYKFVTVIPKLYILKHARPTEEEQKQFVFLSNSDRPLTKYLKNKGLFFMTQFFAVSEMDVFMLMATITEDLYEADSEDDESCEDPSEF